MTDRKRKLIEVALPLDEINAAAKADKDRKTGTIRNLHKWFAPMPLPAWRAILFAALVDDPEDDNKRVYLLDLIKRLVENGADLPDVEVLNEAKEVLRRQFPNGVPTVMDPFCGGGSTLVEGQRLGLPTFGSDLNPVPALITRTLTEVLPKIHGQQPLHPEPVGTTRAPRRYGSGSTLSAGQTTLDDPISARTYSGYEGLARDVSYYAGVVLDHAWGSVSSVFPTSNDEVPVAWLWARTARCMNPACGIQTVLTTSWWLSKKPANLAWIEPAVEDGRVVLSVVSGQRAGGAPAPPKVGRGATFACIGCGSLLNEAALQQQSSSPGLGLRLTAVVSEVNGKRAYRESTPEEEDIALSVEFDRSDYEIPLGNDPRSIWCVKYGVHTQADLYTKRQLLTLDAFANGVAGLREELTADGASEDWSVAVMTLLALAVGQLARSGSTQCLWRPRTTAHGKAESAFGRNDIPMMWDFAETFAKGGSVGDWMQMCTSMGRSLNFAPNGTGEVRRADARSTRSERGALVATDPPYFDAIGYADLSDYFYVWHRRALRAVHSDLYATVAAPKAGELTAIPSHHGNDKEAARTYFIDGFTQAFANLQESLMEGLPMLVIYASKEQKGGREEETRWSSILTALINANFEITGTWPFRGTTEARMISAGTNAVASYIIMVCRPREESALTCSLADFNRSLRRELGQAVRDLQLASILPVDLAQAAMGPGMQIYSRYRAVLDQSGERVPVEKALRLINAALSEVLEEQEGELDPESRFAVRWWEAYGWSSASFGEADKTARPLGISVDDVARAEVVVSRANKVQLLGDGEMSPDWTPAGDARATAWEAVHHLAHRLIDRGGELEAARLMAVLGNLQDPSMSLTYRLHDIAAKKGRTADQERYNALINSWAELIKLAGDGTTATEGLF